MRGKRFIQSMIRLVLSSRKFAGGADLTRRGCGVPMRQIGADCVSSILDNSNT